VRLADEWVALKGSEAGSESPKHIWHFVFGQLWLLNEGACVSWGMAVVGRKTARHYTLFDRTRTHVDWNTLISCSKQLNHKLIWQTAVKKMNELL
jgi:hypothetical protein